MIRGKYEVYSGRSQKTDDAIPKKPLMIIFLPDGRNIIINGFLGIAASVFWERPEYASYSPLIIFFLPKWYQYFIIFQGFSDDLMLCEIPDAIIKIGEKHD